MRSPRPGGLGPTVPGHTPWKGEGYTGCFPSYTHCLLCRGPCKHLCKDQPLLSAARPAGRFSVLSSWAVPRGCASLPCSPRSPWPSPGAAGITRTVPGCALSQTDSKPSRFTSWSKPSRFTSWLRARPSRLGTSLWVVCLGLWRCPVTAGTWLSSEHAHTLTS